MPKHIDDILLAAGIPAEDVVKINSVKEEEAATFDNKPYVDKITTAYKTKFENDPTFFSDITLEKLPVEVNKKIQATQFARASNIMKDKVLKGLGLTESDLGELTDEQKEKLDPYIAAALDKYTKTKAGDKQLQEDLIKARKKLEEFDGYEEKVKTKYESEYSQKEAAAILNATLISELSSIAGLKIKASTLAREAKDLLMSKFAFEKVGDFAIELRQKSNPQMKVLKDNSSHELSLRDALTEIAEKEGWIEKKTEEGKEKGSGVVTVVKPNGTGKLQMSSHIADKISQKIATEK